MKRWISIISSLLCKDENDSGWRLGEDISTWSLDRIGSRCNKPCLDLVLHYNAQDWLQRTDQICHYSRQPWVRVRNLQVSHEKQKPLSFTSRSQGPVFYFRGGPRHDGCFFLFQRYQWGAKEEAKTSGKPSCIKACSSARIIKSFKDKLRGRTDFLFSMNYVHTHSS